MNPVETYLEELYAIRSSGGDVTETSYYPALSNLLNEVGKTLKPRVRCIINIQNAGAGLPDGGLYAAEQFLITRMMAERPHEQNAITITSVLPDYHLLRPNAIAIPIRIRLGENRDDRTQNHLFDAKNSAQSPKANLSTIARAYVASLGIADPDADERTAALIWMHALAIGYSPTYLEENADGIRSDWPRIPLPTSKEALLHSAELGRKVAALLDTERGVTGVTEGKLEKPLDTIGVISRVGGGQLQTVEDEPKGKTSELRITAGWGHGGKGGITMPGKGKLIERDYTPEERQAIEEGAKRQGLSTEEIFAHLGERTCDVYLNDVAYWKSIPARVWDYTIGGYQVIKKWLSYREHKLLGRPLTTDEAREVMNISRRIATILLLEPSLDANYQAIKTTTYP
jgi:hypothetical protein